MTKTLGVLIGGIFIGAVAVEVIRKKYPETLNKLCAKTREIASGAREAFRKGYRGAKQSPKAAESST